MHNHDYAEIFWVEAGSGTHLINGQKSTLKPGHLVMMRPDDQHTFTGSKQGLTIMNLAFSMDTLSHLRDRYFADSHSYFWSTNFLPYQTTLDMALIKTISQNAERVWKFQQSHLYLDSLLLLIFRLVDGNDSVSDDQQIPSWLSNAIQDFFTNELFSQGPRGFAELCGRNIDHVNRMVRKYYDKTLSDLVTTLRMNFAAKQLSITNVPIKTICSDCGFNNLGHFYKTFRDIYHLTPSQYRRQHQTIV
ncbi:MAG: helix-turn-helix domain-containing protein [Chitinophaga sp.]|nr:helix-turn-helix domain-containing protein [Chitinophaga sp.]